MITMLSTVSAFALAYAGMTGLSLAMDRHWRQLRAAAYGPAVGERRLARFLGWILLAGSAWLAVIGHGVAAGAVLWLGVLSVAGLVLVMLLSYAPRWAFRLALAACCVPMLLLVPPL
jgi:hypothetical protein